MIEFVVNQRGDLAVIQRDVSPTVYLDHWALLEISANQTLADRLTAALKARNGTLALSWLNLAEFTSITMEEQVHNAESLLEAILPQVFLLDTDLCTVINREDRLCVRPHRDDDFLKTLIGLKPTSLNVLTARGLFKAVQGRSDARNFALIEALRSALAARQEQAALDSFIKNLEREFRPVLRHLPSSPQPEKGTLLILCELVRSLSEDKRTKITRNYVDDLFHAVVPVAYCDFVLLDKYWEDRVERIRKRLKAAGRSVPIARVLSGKENGIERFLCELESG
jgi:hypothetical protein